MDQGAPWHETQGLQRRLVNDKPIDAVAIAWGRYRCADLRGSNKG
jgi:hypothetical protein